VKIRDLIFDKDKEEVKKICFRAAVNQSKIRITIFAQLVFIQEIMSWQKLSMELDYILRCAANIMYDSSRWLSVRSTNGRDMENFFTSG
jgi:hypothetical protein